jgi:hypothetical protein
MGSLILNQSQNQFTKERNAMKIGRVHYLVALAVGVAVALGIYALQRSSPSERAPSVNGNQVGSTARDRAVEPRTALAVTQSSAPSDGTQGKSARLATLVASGNPADAFAAYNMTMDCVWARQRYQQADLQPIGERSDETKAALADGTLMSKVAESCGDMTDTQIRDRLKYVEAAAAAGIPMAALRLSAEGPFGDPTALANRPDDPAVLEWRQRVSGLIKLAADRGDLTAMASLSNMYESGTGIIGQKDPYKALEYATAKWELQKQLTGAASPYQEKLSAKLASSLTAEQAQSARESGYRIAATAISTGSAK